MSDCDFLTKLDHVSECDEKTVKRSHSEPQLERLTEYLFSDTAAETFLALPEDLQQLVIKILPSALAAFFRGTVHHWRREKKALWA